MICTLNKTQKEATLKLLNRLVQVNKVDSPEKILQNVYNVVFESFAKKDMQKDAEPFAFAMTQYAADNLYLLLETENEGIRELLAKVAGTHYQFSLENIEKFKKEDELKKLLGIKQSQVESIPSTVSLPDVQKHINKIAVTFPQISNSVTYVRNSYPYTDWTFTVIKNNKGEDVKLIRVTEFLSQAKVKNMVPADTIKTRAGTLTDLVIRKFFANPVSYEQFQKNMIKDKEFTDTFRRFSENTSTPKTEVSSSVLNRYMEEYLKDMMYAINFIQTNYQDAYVADLSTLVEKSNMTPGERAQFYIYSAELGLRGEIDLIAIKPDGTYTIIDIKTTDGFNTEVQNAKHSKQASLYDMLMSKVTGMKSSGVNDIIYLTTSISNPTRIMTKDSGNYKLSISAYRKKTNNNEKAENLAKEVSLYKSQIDIAYQKTTTVHDSNQEVKPLSPFSPINMIRGRKKPGDKKDPLKQIFNPNEELSTHESLVEGKSWIHSVFPELTDAQVPIIRIANSNAGGEFFIDAIKLYEKSNKGVAYHEGWHRFSQLYLTKKEKTEMYESVRKDKIKFTTRDGREVNSYSASFIDIEEFLAEEFRKFVKNPEKYTFPKGNPAPKNIFQKIWEAIKAIATFWKKNGNMSFEKIFSEVYSGTFNRTNFSVDNAIFTHLNSFFVDSVTGKDTLLDNITFIKFRDFSDFTLSQYLSVNDITITDLLSSTGLEELNDVIRDTLVEQRDAIILSRNQISQEIQDTDDESIKERLQANDENLKFFQNSLDVILEQNANGDFIKFADYIRAYFKTSTFETLRKFAGKNQEKVNQIINEENLADYEKDEELGEELEDFDEKPETNDEFEFNRSGNEKEALANAKSELKDLFVGFPRRKNANLAFANDESLYEYDKGGLPIVISKQEAFYKSLRILQGSLTLENIIMRLNNPSNYLVFPELLTLKEKLLGSTINEGLIPKLQRLSHLMQFGTPTEQEIQDHTKLMSFLMHFAHVMSLRNVPFETFIVKLNYEQDDNSIHTTSPLQTRDNLESIIYSIMNDFTKGFQLNTERKFMNSDKKFSNVFDVLYNIFGKGQQEVENFMTNFGSQEFIYDPQYKKFYFNSMYVFKKFQNNNPSDREMKDFFSYLGINLNEKIYDNEADRKELSSIYRRLKDIIWAFHRKTYDNIVKTYSRGTITKRVEAWKAAKDAASNPNLTGMQKFIANTALIDAEASLNGYVNMLFTSNPVEQMLFDSKDSDLMRSDSKNKIFAANRAIFEQLAKIEKNYHKRFSSGSMLVVDKLQFSYFLPNNMLLTEMLINEHINSIDDFSKYPELAHLDPVKNPQIMNSWIFARIFNKDGTKKENIKLGVSNISQLSVINTDQTVESKRMQDLKEDEKILFDFLMGISDGSTEIRRLETSNTAYRLSLQNVDNIGKKFIKPVKIRTEGFSSPVFLSNVRNYIQHAAWKYQYNQDSDNRKIDVNYAGMDTLGVFDEMLTLSAPKVKSFIKEKGGDMNTLMSRIEQSDPELFSQINKEIAEYFEGVAIKNEDSYKNLFKDRLSEKGRAILSNLSSIQSTETLISVDALGNLSDYLYRDFIANDFIMTMEDSLLFFGDYTYYKDPIKRRKIIGNNGSINIIDNIMSEAIAAQRKANSLTTIHQEAKGIISDKNNKLVRKTVVSDVKMNSKAISRNENGEMDMAIKIQMLREQIFGKKVSLEQIEEEKKETIVAFTDMEVGDAAAWINLDTYRIMRMREMTWDMDKDESEYRRQILIHKRNLDIPLTDSEKDFVNKGPYSAFNVAKFAMTGPVYGMENMPFKPAFDKMGLRVLLPELDWNRSSRSILENILEKDLDYMVFDTGSKVYKPAISKVFSDNAINNVLNKGTAVYNEHAGGFYKYQQNTTQLNDKSTFSVQLRSIFYEIMLIQKQNGKVSDNLQKSYSKVIKSISDYITINSSRSLTEMGLDINGRIRDRVTFINYLKDRLLDIGGVDEQLIDLLNVNQSGELSTYLEALPFQKNIIDLIAGVVDDNFRKIKLNGTKFYQSPEIGTTITSKKIEDIPQHLRGTIELKWHDLEIVDGKVISTTPVECKINFRSQFRPLFNLKHPDGTSIAWYEKNPITNKRELNKEKSIRRLNEAIQNPEWARTNKESITFIGVRIPLQDINFSSHIIIKEFLAETVGDMIILPPEFYKQTGSDNDIDTVTATFRYLDNNGKPIKRPTEEFADIVNRINELSIQNVENVTIVDDLSLEEQLQSIKQLFIENNIYASKQAGLDIMDKEFTIVETEGFRTLSGLMDRKSILYKIIKNGEYTDQVNTVMEFVQQMNEQTLSIKSDNKKELASLIRKRNNYLKGVTNDIVRSIFDFMEVPENYDFLTETDSITKIKDLAAQNIARKTGVSVDSIKLGRQQTSLEAMSYVMNILNHKNNFEVRSILGSIVKFRSILSLLAKIDTTLNKQYIGGSMINLINRKQSQSDIETVMRREYDKTYSRTIYTPLLYKKSTTNGIEISIFDENGERITKNLSMIASSLLDLFKNMDVFPSLGISWLNVKPLIFLMASGVPMDRAILFLNNPLVQEVQKELNNLGTDAKDRHALVSVTQKFSGDDIFMAATEPGFHPNTYNVKNNDGNKEVINKMLGRPAKAAEKYLGGKYLHFSEQELIDFTEEYGKFLSSPERQSYSRNLAAFIRVNPQYKEMTKDIAAYYATLLEDGDIFYAYFIKGLNRNSSKLNSDSAIASAKAIKKARVTTNIVNPEFEDKLENESTHSPFFKDVIIQNVLANAMPELLDNPDVYFKNSFRTMIENITSKTFGGVEDKRNVEMRVLSDFVEFIYKNFYILKTNEGKGNTLYEFFQYDITPLLGPLTEGAENYKKFIDEFSVHREAILSEDTKIERLFSESLFANQIEMFRAKYPELRDIKIVDELLSKKEHSRNPRKDSNLEAKDILNMLSQSYIMLNLSTNPKDKEAEEIIIRDEWKKMLTFNISSFPSIEAEIAKDPARIDFYQNKSNIVEIREFFRLLAYYSLAQSSHINKTRASFSYLAPPSIIKEVVEDSINNFNKFIKSAGSMFDNMGTGNETGRKKAIDDILHKFEKTFKEMNGDLKWQDPIVPKSDILQVQSIQEGDEEFGTEESMFPTIKRSRKDPGLPYMKAHTGKLYSKIEDNTMDYFKSKLATEKDVDMNARNSFKIQIFNNEGDPLNCSI